MLSPQIRCVTFMQANKTLFKPRKVYFFWMTREQSAPQYFQSTLESIKALDNNDFLELNIYLTAALPDNDLRTTVAKVSQALNGYMSVWQSKAYLSQIPLLNTRVLGKSPILT